LNFARKIRIKTHSKWLEPDKKGLSHKNRFSNFRLFCPNPKGRKGKIAKTPFRAGVNFSDFRLFGLIYIFMRKPCQTKTKAGRHQRYPPAPNLLLRV
jgi:hypothetical protein